MDKPICLSMTDAVVVINAFRVVGNNSQHKKIADDMHAQMYKAATEKVDTHLLEVERKKTQPLGVKIISCKCGHLEKAHSSGKLCLACERCPGYEPENGVTNGIDAASEGCD